MLQGLCRRTRCGKLALMERNPADRRSSFSKILVFLIAIAALAAFINLNRLMAPPYPKPQKTNSAPATTNQPPQ